MNTEAAGIPLGSEGLKIYPFGNGAERMLENKQVGAHFMELNLNVHNHRHLFRAAQEGIVFSFAYGLEIMKNMGLKPASIKAGKANMFLSDIFKNTFATITNTPIELYDTDGAKGAALGAGYGAGLFATLEEAFRNLRQIQLMEPDSNRHNEVGEAYESWLNMLNKILSG